MPLKRSGLYNLLHNKSFVLLLFGQGIASIGDTFQFLSATMLLYNITGSGLSAGFSLICAPIPSIIFSSFAGSLGDRFPEKYLMNVLNLMKALTVILFIARSDKLLIYFLIVLITCMNVFYNPPSKKILVNVLQSNEIILGNSIMGGVSGIVNFIGPFATGLVISHYGVDVGFGISSLCFCISAVVLLLVENKLRSTDRKTVRSNFNSGLINEIRNGYMYYRSHIQIRDLVNINTFVGFTAASLNIAFYTFAFDVLRVTSEGLGFLLSIFYGANLIVALILILLDGKINTIPQFYILPPLLLIAGAWFSYAVAENMPQVVVFLVLEGIASTFFGIFVTARMQMITEKKYLGRIVGVGDVLNNVGRLAGIGVAYSMMGSFSPRLVFIVDSVLLFVFALYKMALSGKTLKNLFVKHHRYF